MVGSWVRLSKEASDTGIGEEAERGDSRPPYLPPTDGLRDRILQTGSRLTARDGLSLCKAPAPPDP